MNPATTPEPLRRTEEPSSRQHATHSGCRIWRLLGYHDSGESGQVEDTAFCAIPAETAAGRLATLIEHYRPQVVVTHYSPHRDHMHTLRVTKLAIYRTDIPAELYPTAKDAASTIDITQAKDVKRKALKCHASQPTGEAFADQEHYFRDLEDAAEHAVQQALCSAQHLAHYTRGRSHEPGRGGDHVAHRVRGRHTGESEKSSGSKHSGSDRPLAEPPRRVPAGRPRRGVAGDHKR